MKSRPPVTNEEVSFTITSLGKGVYTMKSGSNPIVVTHTYKDSEGKDVPGNDIVRQVDSGVPTSITLTPDPSTNVGTNGLYPGIWYDATYGDKVSVQWQSQKCKDTALNQMCATPGDTNIQLVLQIMLIPLNIEGKDIDLPSKLIHGNCMRTNDPDMGLSWFTSWATNSVNAPVACDEPKTQATNNCNFSSLKACTNRYLYNVCTKDSMCGTCMGVCPGGDDKHCMYDLTASITGNPPLTCDPVTTSTALWDVFKAAFKKHMAYFIVGGIVALILLILLIYGIYRLVRKKPSSVYKDQQGYPLRS